MDASMLEVSHLRTYYPAGRGRQLHAVDDVSFRIDAGQTLGLVGESGCGKTTCGKTCMGMLPKTSGSVLFRGADVHAMGRAQRRAFARGAQMVFQDPYASLDPQQKVYSIVAEGIRIHHLASGRAQERAMVEELLGQVGLGMECAERGVHEFSGGQRQRIGIARALSVGPELLVCDEPVSALDVSLQAQVMNLLARLRAERGLSMLFIAHDLAVVRHISDAVGVMYLGQLVERADTDELYAHPVHPYTRALLAAAPVPDPRASRARARVPLAGEAPSPVDPPAGCRFAARCPLATPACRASDPPVVEVAPGHTVRCHACA